MNLDDALESIAERMKAEGLLLRPADDEAIAIAEQRLSVRFPASYRQFLRKVGGAAVKAREIFGIHGAASDADRVMTVVDVSGYLEELESNETAAVVISDDGFGNYYMMRCPIDRDQDEVPVRFWVNATDDASKIVAPSFEVFLMTHLQP